MFFTTVVPLSAVSVIASEAKQSDNVLLGFSQCQDAASIGAEYQLLECL